MPRFKPAARRPQITQAVLTALTGYRRHSESSRRMNRAWDVCYLWCRTSPRLAFTLFRPHTQTWRPSSSAASSIAYGLWQRWSWISWNTGHWPLALTPLSSGHQRIWTLTAIVPELLCRPCASFDKTKNFTETLVWGRQHHTLQNLYRIFAEPLHNCSQNLHRIFTLFFTHFNSVNLHIS